MERKKRKKPLEIKKLNNNYYLYYSTSRWDKENRKIKKVSEYIGRITTKGVIERQERFVRSIHEYGNSKFLEILSEDIRKSLEKSFPFIWEDILACAIVKTIQPLPLKLIKSRWEKLHLSKVVNASVSPNNLTDILRKVGKDYASQKEFFDSLMTRSKNLAFDLSSIFSYSENLKYAEKGHNADHLYLRQINFLMLFSIDKQLPVFMKPLPGSVRDIKALKSVLDELKAKNSILVLDRGFASYYLPELIKKNEMNFILPLRRNFKIINYSSKTKETFPYRKRGIKFTKIKKGKNFLYLFEDVKLRADEESTFIQLIEEKKKTRKEYEDASKKFGKISILSNLDEDGKNIYLMYKNREDVEVSFDSLKNELENDKTYLGDDDAIRGYFFISFISLYLYCKILKILKKKDLIDKWSVKEVLLELSKVYEITLGEKKKLSEIPEKVLKMEKLLGVDIFPKKL